MSIPITGTHPISPPNWQRSRAATSYMLEPPTVAFPEPQLYRATPAGAHSSLPSTPGRISRHRLGASLHITPGLSHRNSVFGPKTHSAELVGFHIQHDSSGLELFQSGMTPESEQEWSRFVPHQTLEALGKNEVERQSVLFEVVKSELDYVNDLQIMRDVYITPLISAPYEIMPKEKGTMFVSEVFWNLNEILAYHQFMLGALFSRQRDQHPLVQSVADIVLDNALLFTPEYESYIKHSPLSVECHLKELDRNPNYKDFIQRCSEDSRLRKRDFKTLLSRPVTRLPRLQLILERIQKVTGADHPDLETIPIILAVLRDFIMRSEPGIAASEEKVKFGALRGSLVDPQGDITDLDLYDDSRTLIHSGPLARQKSDTQDSWSHVFGALLDNYFLLLKEETKISGAIERSHVIRPIPLECLRLASFDESPEVRKERADSGGPISTSSTKQTMYPFTIYHAAAKITRQHTIYTQSASKRSRWYAALNSAIAARKSRQDGKTLYTTRILNDRFFRIPPRGQFTRWAHYTGRAVCAAGFTFQGESYIAVGCTRGIYISKHATEYSFRRVLEFNEPMSMIAIPVFNKFLVHCEMALYSCPLDMIVRAFRGDATFEDLDNSIERLAETHGAVLFLKTGRVAGRTLVIYAASTSKQTSAHILELTQEGRDPWTPAKYQHLSSIPVPEDPHSAVFFPNKLAICASRAIYVVDPLNSTNPSLKVMPDLPNSRRDKKTLRFVPKAKGDATKILELMGKADILGMVTYENDILLIYEDFGCFVDHAGRPARTSYYTQWERKASAYARRGPHLLLLSLGYIEVRNIDTGRLAQMAEVNEMRLLRSGLTEPGMLVAAMIGDTEDDGGRTEKIVELLYSGN